jgi:hypothetical protein
LRIKTPPGADSSALTHTCEPASPAVME